MFVLDTSAASTIMHRVPASLDRLAKHAPADVVLASPPVAAEISFGLAQLGPSTKRRRLLEGEYRRLRELVRSARTGTRPRRGNSVSSRRGSSPEVGIIDDLDIAIGSIAAQLGARLATHNARHFRELEIDVNDWGPPLG